LLNTAHRLMLVLILAVTGTLLAFVRPAFADTIVVHPGESIQAALNHASGGDTIVVEPGTYAENLYIPKNRITLKGGGASARGTVLVPPATPDNNPCVEASGGEQVDGICLVGQFDPNTGQLGAPITGTSVSGFLIQGFTSGFGAFALNAADTVFEHNAFVDNGEYGVAAFVSTGTQFLYNRATGSEEAGFYIGDSEQAGAVLTGNYAADNLFGIFIRDAAVGTVSDNQVTQNCVGIMFLSTAQHPTAKAWDATHNQAWRNDKACPPGEGPPLSGIGIAIAGGKNITLKENTLWRNRPTGDSAFSGGIVVVQPGPGGAEPVGNRITANVAFRNLPVDIFYDGTGSDNQFRGNKCNTSHPNGLCASAPGPSR
jgi:parallel beta helix pectate lyase-like protein